MIKTIFPYFLLAVMAVLLFLLWQTNRELERYRVADNRRAQEAIAEYKFIAERAEHRGDSLSRAFVETHTRDSLALRAVKIDNKAKSKRVVDLRPTVQPLIDSIADLKTFVNAYDSLLAGKNQEIRELESRHIGQILDLQAILKEKTSQIMAQIAINESLGQAHTNLETDLKKQKRKTGFWKVTTGILVGGVIYLSLKE